MYIRTYLQLGRMALNCLLVEKIVPFYLNLVADKGSIS